MIYETLRQTELVCALDVIKVINREIAEYATGTWVVCANGDCSELISRLYEFQDDEDHDDDDDEIDNDDEMHFCVDCTLDLVEHRCVHCWEQELLHLSSCSRCRGCGKVMLSGCSCGVCLDEGCDGRFCIDCHRTTECVACHRYICRMHCCVDNAHDLDSDEDEETEDDSDDDELDENTADETTDDDTNDDHAFVAQNMADSSNVYVCTQCGDHRV